MERIHTLQDRGKRGVLISGQPGIGEEASVIPYSYANDYYQAKLRSCYMH